MSESPRGASSGRPRLRVLGGCFLEKGGRTIPRPTGGHRPLAVLALMAAEHPRPVSRSKLVALLWPDSPPRRARHRLSDCLYRLRGALGADTLITAGDDLSIRSDTVTCDLWEFTSALDAGELAAAIALYSGPFLDGFPFRNEDEFERWAELERGHLARRFHGALERMARECGEAGDPGGAARWWRRLAEADPMNGSAVLHLMEALVASGRRGEALRCAERHALVMQTEFDAEPDPEVRELAERLRTVPSPASESAPATPSPTDLARSAPWSQASGSVPGGHPHSRRDLKRAAWLVWTVALAAGAGWALLNVPETGPAEIHRVAVLPLTNLTGDPAQDYFVDGMHEALVAELGRSADLTVLSRQSVLRYQGSDRTLPEIARELGVDALVEGSIFRAGDSVRVTAQLVRAAPEEHLWAEAYHGAVGEALSLQSQVARAISEAVHARAGPTTPARAPSPGTLNPDAQEAYLRGLYHLERAGLGTLPLEEGREAHRSAIGYFEEAVARDPGWAAAHARLALAYHWLASQLPSVEEEFYPKAKASALRALELDETEAQGHASLGFVLFFFEWDWIGAEHAYRRALELDPNAHHSIYAGFLRAAGRYDEAATHFRLAEERNPLSRRLKRELVVAYYCAGRYDEALTQAEHVSGLWPELELAHINYFRGNVHTARSMHAEAIAQYSEAVVLSDSATWALGGLAYGHARAGHHVEARQLLNWLEEERPGTDLSVVYVALGETERAVAIVEAEFRQRGLRALWDLRCFPEFETLRTHPGIRRILRSLGLPE